MSRAGLAAAVTSLGLLTLIAGCGGGSDGPSATKTVTVTAEPSVTPTTTLEASATPEETPTESFAPNVGDRALRVGQVRRGQSFTTQLSTIRYPYPPGEYRTPEQGKQFLGLNIRQCMLPDAEPTGYDQSTYNGEWYAVSPSGIQVSGSGSSWNDWPAPKFPELVGLNPGDCLRGWIALEVPIGMKIKKIVYRPDGETVAEWLP